MKPLVAILFILGIGWALLAWIIVLTPIGIIMPEYKFQSGDVAFSILGASLSIIGYWIWFGWGFYLRTGRYPLTSSRQFWSVSLAIHVLWAFAIPFGIIVFQRKEISSYGQTFVEFWRLEYYRAYSSWIGLNIVAAIVAILSNRPSQIQTSTEAEQGGRGDGGNPSN